MPWQFWKSVIPAASHDPHAASKKRNYKFSQHDVLGTGGSSVVYKATWNGQDSVKPLNILPKNGTQVVALKIVPKHNIIFREQYLNVLRRQEDMNHPSYLCLLDWFETSSKYYLGFELAAGGDLFDRLVAHPYSEHQARAMMRQMLDAVTYCHSVGLIHRDIKPENWLFRKAAREDCPLLSDFGVGYVLSSPEEKEKLYDVCGTPGYAAPEVYSRKGYTRKCDVFSCGVVGYALMTAWSPWEADDAEGLIKESATAKITFKGSNWAGVSDQAKEFIAWLMQADPNKRPSVAEALRHPWLNQQLLSSDETPSQSIERISAEDGDDRRALQPSSLTHLPTLSHHRGDDALCRRLTEKGLDALDQEP